MDAATIAVVVAGVSFDTMVLSQALSETKKKCNSSVK